MKIILSLGLIIVFGTCFSQEEQLKERISQPSTTEVYQDVPIVSPGITTEPPSDAIVLFDGNNIKEWRSLKLKSPAKIEEVKSYISQYGNKQGLEDAPWQIDQGELVVLPGTGAIHTQRDFGDIQLHLEWLAPVAEGKRGQQYSNSGIFLMGLYEIQILNSFENQTYSNGQAGSIYKQHAPLANASRPAGEWQVYDLVFTAPRFSEKGSLIIPAMITLFHNGVLVQHNTPIIGPTLYIGSSHYIPHKEKLPLMIQDHGDEIRFRNIWLREL
ncbi:MAG: DUF1080 domain-containing protein [Marinoscillum sp.]